MSNAVMDSMLEDTAWIMGLPKHLRKELLKRTGRANSGRKKIRKDTDARSLELAIKVRLRIHMDNEKEERRMLSVAKRRNKSAVSKKEAMELVRFKAIARELFHEFKNMVDAPNDGPYLYLPESILSKCEVRGVSYNWLPEGNIDRFKNPSDF